jgi:trans-L-3-hydroxyproline dehydratase
MLAVGLDWSARDVRRDSAVVTTLDVHAAGEPLRILTGGLPEVPGATMLERRRWMREHFDDLRRALMHEPRGHRDMYGCVVTPPVSPEADVGVLFLHNEGYSTMCGHGIVALVTALVETGALPSRGERTPVAVDTPAGLVRATAHVRPDGRVERVAFVNVPSFLYRRDLTVHLAGIAPATVDIAFGGAFYAIVSAEALGLRVTPEQLEPLVHLAEATAAAVNDAVPVEHPLEDDLGFLYGVIFTDAPEDPAHHSRNLCVFAASEVDRSPTGTGVSARLAVHHAKGEVQEGETIAVESILGRDSVFEGRIVGLGEVGPYPAVVPEVSGRAFITGRHEFILHPDDPFRHGFLLSPSR